jgi:hypothetical protein
MSDRVSDVMTKHPPYSYRGGDSLLPPVEPPEPLEPIEPTADELRFILRVLNEGGTDWFSLMLMLVSSVLLIVSYLYTMHGWLDLTFLFVSLAIFAYWCFQAKERSRRRAEALEIVRQCRGDSFSDSFLSLNEWLKVRAAHGRATLDALRRSRR